MFDLRLLRENPEQLRQAIAAKRAAVDLDLLLSLDQQRRALRLQLDQLNADRNARSKEIGARIKAGQDAEEARSAVRNLGEQIAATEQQAREVQEEFDCLVLTVPKMPHSSTPPGQSEADNQVVKTWGERRQFDFIPKPHWEIGEALGILDLSRGAKISASGFYVLRGHGARLERSLINWFIDVHVTEFGYTEIWPPPPSQFDNDARNWTASQNG